MSLKVIKSSLFDKPGGTTQRIELTSIVQQCKQRLKMNSQSTSRFVAGSIQQLKAAQAKSIEKLTQKSKSIKFHSVYENYQKIAKKKENGPLILPQKLELFHKGLYYRCSQRPNKAKHQEKLKQQLKQYFQRQPQQEKELREIENSINQSKKLQKHKNRVASHNN